MMSKGNFLRKTCLALLTACIIFCGANSRIAAQTSIKSDSITTPIEFELLKYHIEILINEAIEKGYLATQGTNNAYTQEIARLAKIGARYKDEFLNLTVGKMVNSFFEVL